jgi:hypothetical protein
VAYEYVKTFYNVKPIIGQRVTLKGTTRQGVISRKRHYDMYVHVKFDGSKVSVPCHPLELIYEEQVEEVTP